MFDWNDLKLLLAAYRARSFGKAAAQLGVSVSTVSRRIETLEEQLGVVLFARTPDGLVPEAAADEVIVHAIEAEQAAARVDAVSRAARSRSSQWVRVAAPPDFSKVVMPVVLRRLLAEQPDAAIELVEATEVSDMVRRAADIAIRAVRPEQGEELVATRLGAVSFGVFAASRYLDAIGEPLDPSRLRWVVWSSPGATRSDWIEAHLPEGASVLRCSDPTTARLAIAAGVGVGVIAKVLAQVTPGLRQLELQMPRPPDAAMWLVGHRAVLELPAVRRVWDFLVATLREGGDALARELDA